MDSSNFSMSQALVPSETNYDNVLSLPEWETISINNLPTAASWKFKLMSKHDARGHLYVWQVGFDGTHLHTLYGIITSSTISTEEIKTNKSGRTLQEQALLVAKEKYIHKFRSGYLVPGSTDTPNAKAMKGHIYKRGVLKRWPVVVDVKLDGMRLLVSHDGSAISSTTYTNIKVGRYSIIEEQCSLLFKYLPFICTLDGELYRHGLSRSEIHSIAKTEKVAHKDIDLIQFHIFDIYWDVNPSIEDRYLTLSTAFEKCLADHGEASLKNIVVLEKYHVYNDQEVEESLDTAIAGGYEGIVIRMSAVGTIEGSPEWEASRYKFSRSTSMYKAKRLIDEEAEIVGVTVAKGKEAGLALLIVRDDYGNRFNIRMGTNSDRADWLRDPAMVIGRKITFRHAGRHEKSHKALQPTGKCFYDPND